MENPQKAITPRHITDHFSSWGGHHTGTLQGDLRAGFVDWAWDVRDEMLAVLHGLDEEVVDQLVDDIAYSIRQSDEFRTAEQGAVERAAQKFLEDHRQELVGALQDSLN